MAGSRKGLQCECTGKRERRNRFFLDESMKASKFIADNISLTENNLSNYEEERNPYVRMFADKDLSSYDEVIFGVPVMQPLSR